MPMTTRGCACSRRATAVVPDRGQPKTKQYFISATPSDLRGSESCESGVQICDERGLGRIGREVRQLPRIRGQIEQLNVAVGVLDVLVRRGTQAPVEAHVAAVATALVAYSALRSATA